MGYYYSAVTGRVNDTQRDNDIFGNKGLESTTLTSNARALLSPRAIRSSNTFQSNLFSHNDHHSQHFKVHYSRPTL